MKNSFKLNEEVVCYKNVKDLRNLIKYYLKHPDERKEIAEKSRKRVHKDHTYINRMKELLNEIQKRQLVKEEYDK